MRAGWLLISMAFAVGCVDPDQPSDGGTDGGVEDAGVDAGLDAGVDAGTDAGVDAGPPERRSWVLSSVLVPINATVGSVVGLDLDEDGTVDNGLVASLKVIKDFGAPLQDDADREIARGQALLLMEAKAHDWTTASNATARLMMGENPDPAPCADQDDLVCARHLSGDAGFDVSGDVLTTPAPGSIAGAKLTVAASSVALPIVIPGNTFWVIARRGRIVGELSATGVSGGRFAGGILAEDVEAALIPAVHGYLTMLILQDCTGGPGGGCMSGSTGQRAIQAFDADADGQVTLEEFRTSSQAETMFVLDLDLDGNGVNDALSFGFAFTAVGAVFDEPIIP